MKKILLTLFLFLFTFSLEAANYSSVDARAKKVPKQYEESLPKLVQYLIKPYENNEEKKARVIMAWIAYHIDYDDFKADTITQSASRRRKRNAIATTGDIFQTRVGVCQDIANLYQRMAGLAGLDSVVITGYAGYGVNRRNMESSRHAWNAVKIDGQWEFVDPTWAMQGDVKAFEDVDSRSEHRREIKKRSQNTFKTNKTRKNRNINSRWFMTKPNEMIKTHYPDDDSWQLLPVPKRMSTFLK